MVPVFGLAAVAVLILSLVDPTVILRAIASASPAWVVAGAGLSLLSVIIVAKKLSLLLLAVGHPTPFRRCTSAILASVTMNLVLPARGGDLGRVLFLADQRGAFPLLIGVIVLERLIDLFALGAITLIMSLTFDTGRAPMWLGLAACGVATGIGGALILFDRVLPRWKKVGEVTMAIRCLTKQPTRFLAAVGLSLLAWMNMVAVMACCFVAVHSAIPLIAVVKVAPIGILAGTLPLTISGIGTREGAMLLLLRGWDQDAQIVAGAFLFACIVFGFVGLVGVLTLGHRILWAVRRSSTGPEVSPPR